MKTFYEFNALDKAQKNIPMSEFKDQVVLVVNTASKCGFTKQYDGLEEIYKAHKDQGLTILAFPCNQFGSQEPGSDEEIQEFCRLNYGVSFPIFSKVEVNGDNTHPIFEYLKKECPGILGSKSIKWNFTKFLIDKEGKPVKRFAPKTEPKDMLDDIKKLL